MKKKKLANYLISHKLVKPYDVISISYAEKINKAIRGGANLIVNRKIACSKTTREGNTRADTSDYITRELMEETNINNKDVSNLRIRKLTPKECWRLMGFSDEDYDNAAKVNSSTQLYKQAGNSIVVNVLMAIFKELLDDPN